MSRKTLLVVAAAVIVTVGASIVLSRFDWFQRNQHVALWLEGIALVLIFVWDRLDAQADHKETLAQIEVTRQQSQFVINSERAWLTADLKWAADKGNITFVDSRVSNDDIVSSTSVTLILEIKNNGRTPAWIENVFCGMEIVGREAQAEQSTWDYIEPLGAEKTHSINLKVNCPGQPQMGVETLHVHVTIDYRDIFESRQMRLEYGIEPLSQILRRLGERKVDVRSPSTWYRKT